MGHAPVAAPSWRLAAPYDENAQGLIVSPFSDLNFGAALLLQLPRGLPGTPGCGGAWLSSLREVAPVTNAVKPTDGSRTYAPSVALAFTSTGLRIMGLDDGCLATFSAPFVEGMRQIDRQRRLGESCNRGAIPGGPIWSGTDSSTVAPTAEPTPIGVHAALLLYHSDQQSLTDLEKKAGACLSQFNVKVVHRIEMSLLRDKNEVVREHFGFVDGISQPIPYGKAIISHGAGTKPKDPDAVHLVAAGDILIGLRNADLERAPGPVVSERYSGAQGLEQGNAPHGYRDLGRDGSYLVIRELRQDVGGFWESMKAAAKSLGAPDSDEWMAQLAQTIALAARVVGRTVDGDPLKKGGIIQKKDGAPANTFGYFQKDRAGLGCPLGSHIRRANPRDGLAPAAGEKGVFLHVSNNHRILRRGRKFGPPYQEGEAPTTERGLLFMAVCTDIARQFEFIQQNWIMNENFAVLYDETDPLVGSAGKFTIPLTPLRARVDVKTFVKLAGGEYFFLPSLPALRFLEALP